MIPRAWSRSVLPLVALSAASLVAPAPARAADKPAAKVESKNDAGESKNDAENITSLSKYMETLLKGNGKYAARDFAGALETYRGAIPLSPKNPLGHYLVAETQMAMGNIAEAEASLKQAEALSDERNPGLRAKILFLTADVFERQKKWEDAKLAWQTYGDYAQKHADVAFAASATSRTQALADMLKQEKAYEGVRQRIAQEKADKAAGGATPAPPKK